MKNTPDHNQKACKPVKFLRDGTCNFDTKISDIIIVTKFTQNIKSELEKMSDILMDKQGVRLSLLDVGQDTEVKV